MVVLLLACATARREPPPEVPAWRVLSEGLPGRWLASIDGRTIEVEYRLLARDSVLLETWMPGTNAETITTYHLDHDRMILTHYCAQGNQPRLHLTRATPDRFVFRRFDATNAGPDSAMLLELVLELDGTTLERIDTYAQGRERDSTTLVFTRAPG